MAKGMAKNGKIPNVTEIVASTMEKMKDKRTPGTMGTFVSRLSAKNLKLLYRARFKESIKGQELMIEALKNESVSTIPDSLLVPIAIDLRLKTTDPSEIKTRLFQYSCL